MYVGRVPERQDGMANQEVSTKRISAEVGRREERESWGGDSAVEGQNNSMIVGAE